MALSRRQFVREVHIVLDETNAFKAAYRVQVRQIVDSADNSVDAERNLDPEPVTLNQLKTFIAAL